jgi:hypothetical protein
MAEDGLSTRLATAQDNGVRPHGRTLGPSGKRPVFLRAARGIGFAMEQGEQSPKGLRNGPVR